MIRFIGAVLLGIGALTVRSQDFVTLTEIGVLDPLLHESSGLARIYNTSNGNFDLWSHNDLRNEPSFLQNTDSIFRFLPTRLDTITRIVDVNIPSGDWEEMTVDKADHIYIGDFGGANGGDDQIIKVDSPNSFSGDPTSTQTDSIEFDYPAMGYSDMEGMVHLNEYLYLFTKRVNPDNNPSLQEGTTYMLKIPDEPAANGVHTAEPVSQFTTRLDPLEHQSYYRVTAAALNPSRNVLVLLTYRRLWIFSCFEGDDFFGGHIEYIEFTNNQKEGIDFINDHEVYISKEGRIGTGSIPKLFHLDISPWIDDSCLRCENLHNGDFTADDYGWVKVQDGTAAGTFEVLNEEAVVNVTSLSSSNWHFSLRQKGFVLESGKEYRISFKAYADADRTFPIIISTETGSQHLWKSFTITSTPGFYAHDFTMTNVTDYNARVNFALGKQVGAVHIDDVSLQEIGCICPIERSFHSPVSGVFHFEASERIVGHNRVVLAGTDIRFDAGQTVELLSDFEVTQGAIFEAYIDGCDGN